MSELNSNTTISLDMSSEKNPPRYSESSIGNQSEIDYQRQEEEEHSDEDEEEVEESQARKAGRPVGSKNKTYKKSQRELRDCSNLNAPKSMMNIVF